MIQQPIALHFTLPEDVKPLTLNPKLLNLTALTQVAGCHGAHRGGPAGGSQARIGFL